MFKSKTKLKFADENGISNIEMYTDLLNSKKKKLYNKLAFLCSPLFSLNPQSSGLFNNLIKKQSKKKLNVFKIILNIFLFLAWNNFILFLWSAKKIINYFYMSKKIINIDNQLIIDVPVITQLVIDSKKYNDRYLGRLSEIIINKNINSIFLFFIVDKKDFNSIANFLKLKKILKSQKINYFTEFDLLSFKFIFQFILFQFTYLKENLILYKNFECLNYKDKILKNEIILSLPKNILPAFARYKIGLEIGNKFNKVNLFNYCEYQEKDKTFFLGLRSENSNTHISAFQPIIKIPSYSNYFIPEEDMVYNIVPDKIYVNGKFYIPNVTNVKYSEPLSLRHSKIFIKQPKLGSHILIALTNDDNENKHMINLIKKSNLSKKNLILKMHPNNNKQLINRLTPSNWTVSKEGIYELFALSDIIVTAGSGTAVEGIASGLSCIIIDCNSNLTSNPLTKLGYHKSWCYASNSNDLEQAYQKLIHFKNNNDEEHNIIKNNYLDLFFTNFDDNKLLSLISCN